MVDVNRKYHGVLTILENARAIIKKVINFKVVDYKNLDKTIYNVRLAQAIDIMAERLSYHGENDCVNQFSLAWNSLSALKASIAAVTNERADSLPIPNLVDLDKDINLFKLSMVYLYVLNGLNVEKCPSSQDYIKALSAAGEWLTTLTVTGPNQLEQELMEQFASFNETEKAELFAFSEAIDLPVLRAAFEKNMQSKVVTEIETNIANIKRMTLANMPIIPFIRLVRQARQAKLRIAGVRLLSVDNEANIASETFSRSQLTVVKYTNQDNKSSYRVYRHEWDKHFLLTVDAVPVDFDSINMAGLPYYSAGIVRVRESDALYYFSRETKTLTLLASDNISLTYLNQTYPISAEADLSRIELTNTDLSLLFTGDISTLRVKQVSFDLDSQTVASLESAPHFPLPGEGALEIKPTQRIPLVDGVGVDSHTKMADPNHLFFKEISRASRKPSTKSTLSLSEKKENLDKEIEALENAILKEEEALEQFRLETANLGDAAEDKAVVDVSKTATPSNDQVALIVNAAANTVDAAAHILSKFMGGPRASIPGAVHGIATLIRGKDTESTLSSINAPSAAVIEPSEQDKSVVKLSESKKLSELTDSLNFKKQALDTLKDEQQRLVNLVELEKNLTNLKKSLVKMDLEELQKVYAKSQAYLKKMSERIDYIREDHFQLPSTQEDEHVLADLRNELAKTKSDIKAADESYEILLSQNSKINGDFSQELAQLKSYYRKILTRQEELDVLCWKIKEQEDKLIGIEKKFSALNHILLQPIRRMQYQMSSFSLLQWGGKILPYLAFLGGAIALTITLGILLNNPFFLAIFVIPSILSITPPLAIAGTAVAGLVVLASAKTITGYRPFFKSEPKDKTVIEAAPEKDAKSSMNPLSIMRSGFGM